MRFHKRILVEFMENPVTRMTKSIVLYNTVHVASRLEMYNFLTPIRIPTDI